MIYLWELDTKTGEYEKIGQLTDEREFIEGEDELCSIFPKEWWQTADVDMILARFNNGRIMASHEEPGSKETEPTLE